MDKNHVDLLYKELSYEIRGAAFEVKKNFGSGHKEVLYQRALAEEFDTRGIKYKREKAIKIYSPKTKKKDWFLSTRFHCRGQNNY